MHLPGWLCALQNKCFVLSACFSFVLISKEEQRGEWVLQVNTLSHTFLNYFVLRYEYLCSSTGGLHTATGAVTTSLVIPEKFQHMLRVFNTNIDGWWKLAFAIMAIKDVR